MTSVDTNILIYAADPDSPHHEISRAFLESFARSRNFVLCELILVELYMQLRNPAIFARSYRAREAVDYCAALKSNPFWRCVDYEPAVGASLWQWARKSRSGFRRIIDARIALTLRHHGVTEFATRNARDFAEFGFARVWNPVE